MFDFFPPASSRHISRLEVKKRGNINPFFHTDNIWVYVMIRVCPAGWPAILSESQNHVGHTREKRSMKEVKKKKGDTEAKNKHPPKKNKTKTKTKPKHTHTHTKNKGKEGKKGGK